MNVYSSCKKMCQVFFLKASCATCSFCFLLRHCLGLYNNTKTATAHTNPTASPLALRQASRACLIELLGELDVPAHISHTVFSGFVSLSPAFHRHLLVSVCTRSLTRSLGSSVSASADSAWPSSLYEPVYVGSATFRTVSLSMWCILQLDGEILS